MPEIEVYTSQKKREQNDYLFEKQEWFLCEDERN